MTYMVLHKSKRVSVSVASDLDNALSKLIERRMNRRFKLRVTSIDRQAGRRQLDVLSNLFSNILRYKDAGLWWKYSLRILWSDRVRESVSPRSGLAIQRGIPNEFVAGGCRLSFVVDL